MKDLEHFKAVAAQMLTLSAELLRMISDDESERAAIIEAAKKTPTENYYTFRQR